MSQSIPTTPPPYFLATDFHANASLPLAEAATDAHPFHPPCGRVLAERYGAVDGCLCHDVDWILEPLGESRWIECSKKAKHFEEGDGYPFCENCGKVLEEGWGAVGACCCGSTEWEFEGELGMD